MKKIKYILLLFFTVTFQCTYGIENTQFLEISANLRCKPATKFIKTQTIGDTFFNTLMIKNTSSKRQDLLLEIPYQQLDKTHVIQYDKNIIIKNYIFTSKKLNQRIYYDRNIIFPVTIDSGAVNTILLAINKSDFHGKIHPEILIWKKDAKISRTEALELTRGIFYGILILYTFICLILTVLMNIKNYYYYFLYLLAGVVYLFVKNNLGYELFWPNYPNIDLFLKKIMLSIYLITSILFLRGFIQRRIHLPSLQNILRYFIYFGMILVFISLLVGLLSTAALNTFIVIQNIFALISLSTVVLTFVFVYFNINERSLVLFTLLYFVSFSFFLFYPQPEFGSDVFGVYVGQIYTYSNAFIIAFIISFSTIYRVIQIVKENELLKKEVSNINANNVFSLIEGQQNERTRVGQELHDGIGIMMSSVKMKISSVKTNHQDTKSALDNLTTEVDEICKTIRIFSHKLLPPTLKKFGIKVALKDMLEEFRQQNKATLNYNYNIPDSISPVSQHVIYDFIRNFLLYFSEYKPEQLTISIYVIPSIHETQIRIQYTGMNMNEQHQHIKSVISVVNILNGKFHIQLLNARNFSVQMEFPIIIDKTENPVTI